jgi:RNA polymerase sigma factor (sigma-70 family)
MSSDGTLLREYTEAGSERSFAELVGKHLDLVYSTALREVGGDQHLAKDISQAVFIDLARKARSLSQRAVLTGWLYRSTCFAASKAVRSERRRQTREQKTQAMQAESSSPVPEPDWQQLSPMLNTVMLELKESDREMLLLRFFERRSLADVGSQFGLSQNAARMRIERALERLRHRLERQGITSTAGGLALVLTQQAVTAAPAGLAGAVTATCVASSAAATGSSLLTVSIMTNAKAILTGAAIAIGAATPVVLQQLQANARLKAALSAARSRLAEQAHAPTHSAEPGDLIGQQREHEELLRLRGEVALLRNRQSATPKAKGDDGEFERLKASKLEKLAQEAAEAQVLLAKAPEIPMLPVSEWTNAGFTTPSLALQTLNWAATHHDTNAFVNAVAWDPQTRARAEELFAALPESARQQYGSLEGVIFDWMISHATPMASYRVLSQSEQGPNDVTLVEQHQYSDDRVRENTIQFHREENGAWQQVLPPELMPKLEVVINNLAGSSTVVGK